MSADVTRSAPQLDGFEVVRLIGSGGFAQVYLYRQLVPAREVAVKVLAREAVAPRGFTDEANLMARVSAHPYIVSIFEARVSSDGRPYLVMEYYPGANYQDRARDERLSVADVLRLGIQVAGALETAHRVGILHRDVKPANILTSAYGRPGLTDFGIASADGSIDVDGLSVPWSPPEALETTTLSVAADVYSLAATVYHLFAGRSPFETPGGDNGTLALISRIRAGQIPPIGRGDVPPGLERLLRGAMATDPAHRPGSMADLARSLQAVEIDMRLTVTPLEIPGVELPVRAPDVPNHDSTQVRQVDAPFATTERSLLDPHATTGRTPETRRRRTPLILATGALLAAIVALASWFVLRDDGNTTAGNGPMGTTLVQKSPMPGVVVTTDWSIGADLTPSGRTAISNTNNSTILLAHVEVVPKELVATVDEMTTTPAFDSVIDADPIVQFCLTLEPGIELVVRWSGPPLDDPIDDQTLAELASGWSDAYDQQQRAPATEPCEFDDPSATTAPTTSTTSTSTTTSTTTTSTTEPGPTTTIAVTPTDVATTVPPSGSTSGGSSGETSTGGSSTSGTTGGSTTGGSTTGGSTTGGSTTGSGGTPATTVAPTTAAPTTASPTTVPATTIPPPPPPTPPPVTDPPAPTTNTVPNVTGDDFSAGAGRIRSAGFEVLKNSVACPGGQPSSQIVGYSPSGVQPLGTTIRLDTCV